MKLQITALEESNAIGMAGDLDIYNAEAAHAALRGYLAQHSALELDLSGVETCDGAGIQILLAARRSAVAADKSFSIRSAAAAIVKCGELLGLPRETWQPPTN